MRERDPMSIFPTKILLATDGSKEAELAFASAAELSEKTGSELHIVYVGHLPLVSYEAPGATTLDPDLSGRMQEGAEQEARTMLDEQVQRVGKTGGEVAEVHARIGRPDAEIVGLADELGAGLIVLGSRGLGPLRRALMGSVSDSVVRHAPCPTLVVREEPLTFPTKILLATDGSEEARLAASTAADLAGGTDSELHVVTVGPFVPTFLATTEEEPARLAREARRTLDEQVGLIEAADGRVAQAHLKLGGA